MKTTQQKHYLTASLAVAALTCFGTAQAATETWDGGHGSANAWFANLNWADDTAPVDFDDLVFTGTTRLNHASYGDFSGTGDAKINSITFDAAAGAFVISNGGGGTHKMLGDITNNSTNLQTLNFPLQLNTNVTANAAAGDITIGGVISEDVAGRQLIKTGDGTLTLTNANTYSGQTAIAGVDSTTSTVNVQHDSALGTAQFQFQRGDILELGVGGLTINNFMSLPNWSAGTRIFKLDLDGAQVGEFSGGMWHQHTTQGKLVFDVGTEDTMTYSGNIEAGSASGAGLTKTGVGTLILSGTNTYKGTTTISAGTLKLSGGSAIIDDRDVFVDASGTLDLNDSVETISRLTGSGTVDNTATGAATLIVGSNGNDATFDGTITDTGAALKFRKTGSGTQTLTAASDYSGGTDIYNGTIVANDSAALGTGQIYMGVNSGVTQTLAIGAGGLNIANNFFLQNSNSTHEIKFDVDGSNASTLSGNMTNQVDYAGKWDVIVGADDTLTLSGNLSSGSAGNSGLDKDGLGTLVLSGANTYKGKTRINEGTLSLATGYTHSRAGDYEVVGGTLKIAHGVDISTHAMTIGLGGVISPGNSPGTATTGAQTWNDGGSYLWEINDMAGTKGDDSGWDWLDIQGTLDINATFDILITSLDLSNNSGLADGFDYTGLSYLDPYASFTIATATGGVSGFDVSDFNLDDSAFINPKVGWSIDNIGNDIVLNAFFVPEPSSTALLGLGGLALILRRKR